MCAGEKGKTARPKGVEWPLGVAPSSSGQFFGAEGCQEPLQGRHGPERESGWKRLGESREELTQIKGKHQPWGLTQAFI